MGKKKKKSVKIEAKNEKSIRGNKVGSFKEISSNKKVKKKIILLREYNIAQMQCILEEEALKGWFFYEKKGPFFYFRKDQAKKLKFRLLPCFEKLSSKEIQMYMKDGWEYIGLLDRMAVFSGKLSADEIKPQPKKTSEIVEKVKNEIFYQLLFLFGIFILAIISIVAVIFSNDYFWKNIADYWNANISIPLIFLTLIIFTGNILVNKIKLLQVVMRIPMEKKSNVKKSIVCNTIINSIFFILIIVSIVSIGYTFTSMFNGVNRRDCLKYKGNNIIELMDIEDINEFYTPEKYEKLGITKSVNTSPIYEGTYSISKTLVCSEHLSWSEKLYNDVNKYSAELVGEYYNLKNTEIAKKIYKEIVNKVIINDKKEGVAGTKISKKKLEEYVFDEKYVIKYGKANTIVIRQGRIIYYIVFSGGKTYEEVLKYINKRFTYDSK